MAMKIGDINGYELIEIPGKCVRYVRPILVGGDEFIPNEWRKGVKNNLNDALRWASWIDCDEESVLQAMEKEARSFIEWLDEQRKTKPEDL